MIITGMVDFIDTVEIQLMVQVDAQIAQNDHGSLGI